MSVFDENNDEIKLSITYFNQLTDEEKIQIVSDLNPNSFKLKIHFRGLFPLLSRIQKDLVRHDEIKIGNKLMEFGLEETYSRLIVTNLKKHAPTLSYQLSQINKIADSLFAENFEKIVNAIWIDDEDESKIIEKYNITRDQFVSIVGVTNQIIMRLLRGDVVEKQVMTDVIDKGLSKQKSEILLKSIESHKKNWYSTLLFSNTQDTFFRMEEIQKQNAMILKSMKEVIRLLRTPTFRERRSLQ